MKTSLIEKYFLFGLLGVVIILTTAILFPFLSVIILAFALTVVLGPVYSWIQKHLTKGISWLSSLLTILFFLIIVCAPLLFVGSIVFNQTQNAYITVTQSTAPDMMIEKIDTTINKLMPTGFSFNTHDKITDLVTFLSSNITNFFSSTFRAGLMFFITMFTVFYLLKDGEEWKKSFIALSPLSENHFNEIISHLTTSINQVLKGSFVIAVAEGIAVSIGLAIFGIPNPALWGVVAGMASFLPVVGVPMIYIPCILFLYFTGMHISAFGLTIWFAVTMFSIDNILGPYFIAKNSEIPSLFILFAILGGISLIGPIGVLIGPIILSLLYSLISIYRKELVLKES